MLFISHSARDEQAAVEVRRRLLERGYDRERIFLDSDTEGGIAPGEEWQKVLYKHLKECRALIAVCTPRWQQSQWCFAELVVAKTLARSVFPLVLEPCDLGLAAEHQAIFIDREGEAGWQRLWNALDGRHLGPREIARWIPENVALTSEVAFAFGSAMAAAQEWESGFLGIPHLLAGLADIDHGLLRSFLSAHSVAPEAWKASLRASVRQMPAHPQAEPIPVPTEGLTEVLKYAQQSVTPVMPELTERLVLRSIFSVRPAYLDQLGRRLGIPLAELQEQVALKATPHADFS